MTTSDDGHLSGLPPEETPEGTVMPNIRGRLRSRLPARIRTARGQLLVLAGYLLLAPIIVGILAVTGALAKMNLATQDIVGATLGNLVVAILCVVAGRLLLRRSLFGYWLAVAIGALAVGAGSWAIYRVITGDQGLAGDPGFFFVLYQSVHVILGAAVLVNLLREIGSLREIAAAADRTGKDLHVELRDIRIRPGAAPSTTSDQPILPGAVAAVPPSKLGVEPLLAVRGLKKHFPIHGGLLRRQIGTVYAVDGVDFDVFPGEIFSLVGESGCGKTTLGRTVLQLTPPTAGKVVVQRRRARRRGPRRHAAAAAADADHLPGPVRVAEPADAGPRHHRRGPPRPGHQRPQGRATSASRTALEIVGLRRDYTRRYPHEFSGGQRQRIGIARALALGPDFIVCDEPVSALDVSIQSQVLNLLLDLRRDFNLTYLFISHNLSVVQYFSDRVGVMYLGKIVEEGAVEQTSTATRATPTRSRCCRPSPIPTLAAARSASC